MDLPHHSLDSPWIPHWRPRSAPRRGAAEVGRTRPHRPGSHHQRVHGGNRGKMTRIMVDKEQSVGFGLLYRSIRGWTNVFEGTLDSNSSLFQGITKYFPFHDACLEVQKSFTVFTRQWVRGLVHQEVARHHRFISSQ